MGRISNLKQEESSQLPFKWSETMWYGNRKSLESSTTYFTTDIKPYSSPISLCPIKMQDSIYQAITSISRQSVAN